MGIGVSIVIGLIMIGIAAVVYISYLSIKALKDYLKRRLEHKNRQKVAFGETRKIVDEHAREILKSSPKMTMEDLERTCEETPYFVVDYNPETDMVSDYTTIRVDEADKKIDNLMHKNKGIILFD